MTLLRTHFDGPGETEKRIAQANNAMENLHYTKESIFPFSSYVTGINACYTTLDNAGDPVTARNQVAKMLKGITTTVNASLIAAMQNIRSNPDTKNDFVAASSKLSEQIALIFPGESRRPSASRGRRVSGAQTGNCQGGGGRGRNVRGGQGYIRGYGRGGRGRGYGRGRGRGASTMADGLNISDVTRSFSDQPRGGPPFRVKTREMSTRNESTGAPPRALPGKSVQLRLLLPSLTDRPSLSTILCQKIIMEELAAPLALAAVPIKAGDVEEGVIDLTLLDTGYRIF